jgi:alpha-galactosidase
MNPQLRIDSCASGGRRNDLETMRRAVPLWRSDYAEVGDRTARGNTNQCFTYVLSA